MISLVHYIGYRLFGEVGDGMYCGDFHFFVDGLGLCVKCTAEDIGETDYIVYLVRIVGTAGGHQYIRTRCHGIFIRDFRGRIGKGEYNRMIGHAAYHVLCQYITFGKSQEYIGTFDGFGKCMHITAVGGKITLLFGQVLTVAGDNPFTVQHQDVFTACTERFV